MAGTVADYQRGIKKTSVGECKTFLQQKFNSAGSAYKLPSGSSPVMPANAVSSEGRGIHNWFWAGDWASGFNPVGVPVSPSSSVTDKRTALTALLRQVQRGDVLQLVMKGNKTTTGQNANDYVPHTIAFVDAYQRDDVPLNWVDSNMDGVGTPLVGTQWPWGESKTISSLADRIATLYGAATLYRVRDDIRR